MLTQREGTWETLFKYNQMMHSLPCVWMGKRHAAVADYFSRFSWTSRTLWPALTCWRGGGGDEARKAGSLSWHLLERLHHPQAWKVYTCGPLLHLSPSLAGPDREPSSTLSSDSCVRCLIVSLSHGPLSDASASIIDVVVLAVQR